MKRAVAINRWAKILYKWSYQCSVDLGLAEGEMIPWVDCTTKDRYVAIAEKLWEAIG